MLSPERIKLMVAITLVSLTLIALGLTVDTGHTAPGKPLRAKLLRRNDKTNAKPDNAEKDYLRKHAAVQDEKKEERELENKIPQHLPIKIKVRAEKEKSARDMSNDRWHRDLEIEVKNTGDKPIYYLSIIFEIPEIKVGNTTLSLGVQYGERSLFGQSKGHADPDDVPIKPKETVILILDDGQARGWDIWRGREKEPQPKRILFLFQELNFGDGTGFFGGNGAPWPLPKRARTAYEFSANFR